MKKFFSHKLLNGILYLTETIKYSNGSITIKYLDNVTKLPVHIEQVKPK